MKSYIYNIGLFFLVSIVSLVSCKDDDTNEVNLITYNPVTVTFIADSNNFTVLEDQLSSTNNTYTITASIPEPQLLDYYITLEQTAGTATEGIDFEFDDHILISHGQTSGSATVTILQSGDIEESDETFSIEARSATNTIKLSDFSFNGTISTNNGANDYINNQLDITLSWDGSAESGDLSITSFCDMDFDLILYDSAFNYVGYVLGSTACPEHDLLGGLADGTYYLVSDLWANPYSGLGLTDEVPLTLTWSQEYFPETAGSISSSSYNLSSPDTVNSSAGLGGMIVVLEVANGYEYTLSTF